jgi:hypothetical protein
MLTYWTLTLVVFAGGRALSSPESEPEGDLVEDESAVEEGDDDEPGGDVDADVDPNQVDADLHVSAATEAYQAGEFERAATEIQAAYELSPSPDLLFPWAQAERQSGDCSAAIKLYARYLAADPGETTADLARDQIENCVVALEDERAAERAAVRVETSRAMEKDRSWIRDPVGGALVGGGVVFMGAGVGMMIGGRSMMIDALESDHANYASEADRAVTVDRLGIAGLSVGVALVAGGIVRYVLVHRRDQREQTARVELGGDLRVHF